MIPCPAGETRQASVEVCIDINQVHVSNTKLVCPLGLYLAVSIFAVQVRASTLAA